jgi:hypothetical protein
LKDVNVGKFIGRNKKSNQMPVFSASSPFEKGRDEKLFMVLFVFLKNKIILK